MGQYLQATLKDAMVVVGCAFEQGRRVRVNDRYSELNPARKFRPAWAEGFRPERRT
jgi:hypothetical protein